MDDQNQIKQAVADFEMFLSGKRAPALIGQSLATVIRLQIPRIVEIIINWAARNSDPSLPNPSLPDQSLLDALMGARNKVFDIFFYRIVKFHGIYNFFPAFEQGLIAACPPAEQERLTALFQEFKWQDIRPIGTILDQQQFIIEKRKEIAVQTDKFNESVYKNATYSVLSTDKKYEFNDPKMGEQIAGYQAKVEGIFSDFIDLIKDKQTKKEILLSNESDRYNSYQKKEAFKIELYLTQLVDLGTALFNDDFLYQSVRIFALIRELRGEYKIQLEELKSFQEKGALFNTQKIEDYANTRTTCLLVKQILSLFTYWHPQRLLNHLQIEESRRVRHMLLKVLECYGKELYGLLVAELSTRAQTLPWYYARNLAYLLGRVNCDDEAAKNKAADLLDGYWQPKAHRSLVNQIISTLGFIGTELACDHLIARLRALEQQMERDQQAADLCQKILHALIAIESDKALEAVIEFCQRNEQLGQYLDKFNKIYLSDRLVQIIAGKIRKELQRLKLSFSILGDKETARELLRLISHMGNEPVQALCHEILKALPRKRVLAAEAERILQQVAPLPFYSMDRVLQKLATVKNLPETICQIAESRNNGKLVVRTAGGVECEIDFDRGEAVQAAVPTYNIERDDAFYWSFLLDTRDIESIYFHVAPSRAQVNMEITRPTEALICEGLVQRGQVLQITGNYLSPESRFRQRPVNSFYTNFHQTEEPEKYQTVWEALAQDIDIATLQQVTHLSKHDVYKILLYFLKQRMLIVDGEQEQKLLLDIEDGLAMLDMNLKRIDRRPVMFNYYNTSAEICADLMRLTEDEVLHFALGILRNYYLEHYQQRRILAETNREICLQVLGLVAGYLRNHTDADRQSLLDYINFTFKVEDASLQAGAAPTPEPVSTTVLEKLENIDLTNDPLDSIAGVSDQTIFDETTVNEMFGSLDSILGSGAGSGELAGEADQGPELSSILTEAEESMIRDLFDNIALAYVKPLKDFIRELYRNWEAGRATSLEWVEIVLPIFTLLSSSSAKMGYQQIADVVTELQNITLEHKALAEQEGWECFNEIAPEAIITTYKKLCDLQPKTFGLVVSEEDLADKKEVLLIKFILKQAPEMNEKLLGRILFAGLNTFDKFMQSRPDEIAALTGMSKELAEEICMKFYQYRNIYYNQNDPEYKQKFLAMFELNLRLLKEMHAEVESLTLEEQAGEEEAKERKETLKLERQRALWSLFILLCIKEEYDLVELIQQSVFEVRIQLLEEYLAMASQISYQPQS